MVSTKYSELIASGPVGIEASKIHIIPMVNINMTGEYIVVNNGESWLIMLNNWLVVSTYPSEIVVFLVVNNG